MSNALPTDYQNFIATSRYARWLDDEGRRETWSETVTRYVDYMAEKVGLDDKDSNDIWERYTQPRCYAIYESFNDCR